MKVVLISQKDYANVGYLMAKGLRTAGVEATAYTFHHHPLNYTESATVVDHMTLTQYTEDILAADIVQYNHSQYVPLPEAADPKVVVFHGGTIYREHQERLNEEWNDRAEMTLIQTTEMLNNEAKNAHQYIPPVDTMLIQPTYVEKLRFAHYPSSPKTKGTGIIDAVLSHSGVEYEVNATRVEWAENLERMKQCSVYIEKQLYEYEWGMQALEAAALGKNVVVAGRYAPKNCPFFFCNSPEALEATIQEFQTLSPSELVELGHLTRQWVEEHYSLQARGNVLKTLYESL